jgi:hypothetical protein
MTRRLTNREKLLTKLNNFSENEIAELLTFATTLEKALPGDPRAEGIAQATEDELLSLLSAARENCRARQVFEWESVRRRAEVKASTQRYR